MKLLIVDDEKAAIAMLKKMIRFDEFGFDTVDEAYNGEEALGILDRYDVVITDIRMPVMDGLTMIRLAVEEYKLPVRFIIISAYSEFHYVKEALRYGVKNYILKPISIEEITEELERIKEELDVNRLDSKSGRYDEKENLKINSGLIHKIKEYIDDHYGEKLSLNNLAKQFYVNPIYLGQVFKNTYKMYFSDYVLKVRMERAKELLSGTKMRILAIAREVGYADYDYFSLSFEKFTGVKPLAYRNRAEQ